jgi:amino-acid N-acetyltransferase
MSWQVVICTGGGATMTPMNDYSAPKIIIRRARTSDVRPIKALIDIYAGKVLLAKELVTLYEDLQEFWVAELNGRIVGCGALHVLWEDIAEIRTVAVDPAVKGRGVGHLLVTRLIDLARELGLERIFVLTFETEFFGRHGFKPIDGTPVSPEVYEELRRSPDAGVAQFLDLAHVKPNTLGNTRMLLELDQHPAGRSGVHR